MFGEANVPPSPIAPVLLIPYTSAAEAETLSVLTPWISATATVA